MYRTLFLLWSFIPAIALALDERAMDVNSDNVVAKNIIGDTVTNDILYRDYGYIKNSDIWLTGNNAAALTRYNHAPISDANIYFRYGEGGFVNYYQPSRDVTFGAAIESFYRLSPKIVLSGGISYDNSSMRNMAGSAFINPERMPFDLEEDSTSNQGDGHLDNYLLTGALGIETFKHLSLGVKVDFGASNYAKYKDLRHKNKHLDLFVSGGAYYDGIPYLTVGIDGFYKRTTESVTFSTYGSGDRIYKTLIAYALHSGRVEQFGNDGFTDKSREMPFIEDGGGLDAQVSVSLNHHLTWFNSLTYLSQEGYYGRKSPYTVTYTDHDRQNIAWKGRVQYVGNKQQHILDYSWGTEKIDCYMRTYISKVNDNGATYYEYGENTLASKKKWNTFDFTYTAYLNIKGELPIWTIQAEMNIFDRTQTMYMYPYQRDQSLKNWLVGVQGKRNIFIHKGILNVGLSISYQKGSGEPYGETASQAASGNTVAEMSDYLYREYDYLTAPQFTVGGEATFSFIIPKTKIKMHAGALVKYKKANDLNIYNIGDQHTLLQLNVGCSF